MLSFMSTMTDTAASVSFAVILMNCQEYSKGLITPSGARIAHVPVIVPPWLRQGIDQNVARWNPGSPENCQCCATQHGSFERDSRPSAFPNLNEASLGRDDRKFLACL